jgi:hypothetical protein
MVLSSGDVADAIRSLKGSFDFAITGGSPDHAVMNADVYNAD